VKRRELRKERVPRLARVAVLGDPSSPSHASQGRERESAARSFGVQGPSREVREPTPAFAGAFAAIPSDRADALLTLSPPLWDVYWDQIVAFTAPQRLPAICKRRTWVDAGGRMSYGANAADLYRRAATCVDPLLHGAKPAELPVEQPVQFDLVINLKTAQARGRTIPPPLLCQAAEVIR
jgi:putative ABC transport system substrate-binding protein